MKIKNEQLSEENLFQVARDVAAPGWEAPRPTPSVLPDAELEGLETWAQEHASLITRASKAPASKSPSTRRATKPKPGEADIERKVCAELRRRGALVIKVNAMGIYTSPIGMPDRLIVGQGFICFFEFKRPGGKLTPMQQRMHAELERRGARVYLVDSYEAGIAAFEREAASGEI